MSEQDKKELIAEGKMLRAMVYFRQAKRFGRVVWIDRILSSNEETYKFPLTESINKTYELIIKDLDDAIAGLPETSKSGKLNRYAASAFKSRVCLQAGAYTGLKTYFEQAVIACDEVITKSTYRLDEDYAGMFNEKKAYTSSEIILAAYRSKANTNCEGTAMQNLVPNISNDKVKNNNGSPFFKTDLIFEAWLESCPSQNLVDDYLVIDETSKKAVVWNKSSQFLNNTNPIPFDEIKNLTASDEEFKQVQLAYGSSSGKRLNELLYENRDKRFYASIVYDSCTYFNEMVTMCKQGNLNRLSGGGLGTSHMTISNYLWRKTVYNVQPRVYYGIPTDYHYVIIRLGEVYLNKAEALLCLAKTDASKLSGAVDAFNATRTIHGQLPSSDVTNLSEAWTDYKRERRVELAYESDYYWSLLRWGKYGYEANSNKEPSDIIEELNEPATFIEISKDRQRCFVGNIGFSNNERKFNTRRYLFPIPQGERNKNEMLKPQNPDW